MTSHVGGPDRDPIDPEYEALFRPEDVSPPPVPAPPAPLDAAGVQVDDVVAEQVDDVVAEPEAEPVPLPRADPVADTGRLFRSQGAVGHDEAVLALTSDHYGRLRTLERRTEDAPAAAVPASSIVLDDAAALDDEAPARRRRRGPSMPSHRSGITAGAVYIVVFGVTLVVAFLNALIAGGDLGWPTGLALLVSSVYAALVVRRPDDTVAIIAPPLAFLVATLTAGQLFLGSAEGSLLNRSTVVFFTLAANWFWVIGATVAALVIVLVRRRRG